MTPPLPTENEEGIRHLRDADPVLAEVIHRVGPCEIKPQRRVDVFQALLRSIIYQQLHANAASAIHGRVLACLPKATPGHLLETPEDTLRTAGLSANKLRAVRDLAEKARDGLVPTAAEARRLDDVALIARLTAVRGIGEWTVHMLMIFHLGRPDVLPTGDFAIRKAFSLLYRRGRAVTPAVLLRHARRWQPHRSVASWYLWRSLDPQVAA